MSKSPAVEGDLPCTMCDYNLRSLPCDGACPECGDSIKRSVMDSPVTPPNYDRMVQFFMYGAWAPVAEQSGYSIDGILFVHSAMRLARRMYAVGAEGHVSAPDFCFAVRDRAIAYFNDRKEAVELLAEWGIRNSGDVGRIVYAMIAHGALKAAPDDKPEDFEGLFTLDTLFDGVTSW